MNRLEEAQVKKDIFVAVITSGSMQQKEQWKATCEKASDWVFGVGIPVNPAPTPTPKVKRIRQKTPQKTK